MMFCLGSYLLTAYKQNKKITIITKNDNIVASLDALILINNRY